MALVVLPEGQQRSGKQGGMVWSHNAGGPYVRNRAIPVNPNTARQVKVRNAVRALTIRWQNTLDANFRSQWDAYARNVTWTNRLGQSIHLSGLNHFVRSNTPRLVSNIACIDEGPHIYNLATAELNLSATASEATQDLTIDGDGAGDWIGEADAWQFFYMGQPQNPSRNFFKGPYRFLTAVPGAGPPPFPVVIAASFPIADGQKIWIRSRVARGDGRLSEFAEYDFLGAA